MTKTEDHYDHALTSRLRTVIAGTVEQKQACSLVRQRVQDQQGLRCRNALTKTDFEQQLLVQDRLSGMPVATVGLRSSLRGGEVEGEFDLRGLMQNKMGYLELDGPVMLPGYSADEVASQCLDFITESGASQLPQALVSRVSLPLGGGDKYVQSLMYCLRSSYLCTNLARPRVPLRRGDVACADDVILPGMLRAFMRRGACIGSEPYWDAEQGRAKILVWLEGEHIFTQPFKHQPGTNRCSETRLSA